MTDGGAENKKIEAKVVFSISHLVAWKNIRSSNSMIERVFHTMKNEYKYILYAEDATELNALLMQTIDAYMDRPHSQLGIYTPREVVMKRDGWFDERRALKDGAEKRLRTNQNSRCINCSCKGMSSCLREGALKVLDNSGRDAAQEDKSLKLLFLDKPNIGANKCILWRCT